MLVAVIFAWPMVMETAPVMLAALQPESPDESVGTMLEL
jgi:hypothetical protein